MMKSRIALIALVLVAALGVTAAAQSGKRVPKQEPPPPPVPASPTSAPPGAAAANPHKPAADAMSLIVGIGRMDDVFSSLPQRYRDYVYEGCLERLRRSGALSVSAIGEITRKEAIDRAKSQSDAHVVWLELTVNSYDQSRTDASLGAPDDRVFLQLTVYAPQTAKVKTSNRIYPDTVRVSSGPVGIGVPSITRRMPLEYRLQMIGAEAANRIMDAFHIPIRD